MSSNTSIPSRAGILKISGEEVDPVYGPDSLLYVKVIQSGIPHVPPPAVQHVEVCQGDSIPDLIVSGNKIKWYSTDQSLSINDQSGNSYRTVAIGDQSWMAKNLRTTLYSDGTSIDYVVDAEDWGNTVSGAYCWYNDNPDMVNIYGALYNWHALNTGKLCPSGWHVPSDEEWNVLINEIGGSAVAGGKLKTEGSVYWEHPNSGATDELGFGALPGGFRDIYGDYHGAGEVGYHWATDESSIYARSKSMKYDNAGVNDLDWHKINGFSVRCVRNENDLLAVGNTFSPDTTDPGVYKYYVTQTIDGIESEKVEIQLIINPKPEIDLGDPCTICEGEDIMLDAGAGFNSYSWNTGENTRTISVNNEGEYSVKVTDSHGCSASDTIHVTIHPLPDIEISGFSEACEGDTLILEAGAGFNPYNWNTGDTTRVIEVLTGGTYSVSVANSFGCSNTGEMDVIFYPLPEVAISGSSTACEGDILTLDAGEGFESYTWNTGEYSRMIDIDSGGNYAVSVVDTNGCAGWDGKEITFYPAPSVFIGNDTVIDQGDTLILSAGPGFSSYYWSNGAVEESITLQNLESGDYSYFVIVSNEYGCTGADTIFITVTLPDNILDFTDKYGMIIYPNPAVNFIVIKTEKPIGEKCFIRIISSTGRSFVFQEMECMDSAMKQQIDISRLKPGVYTMEFITDHSLARIRFIKL